jgi:glutathione S-transferase
MRRLITIPISHYCEKARWALERAGLDYREEPHVQVVHRLVSRRAGGEGTTPVLVAPEGVFVQSREILAYADAWLDEPLRLFPANAADRGEVDAVCHWLDEDLGPAGRRLMYAHMEPQRELMLATNNQGVPAWEDRALRLTWPVAMRIVKRVLEIDDRTIARDEPRVQRSFERVSQRLADGRPFLCGERFSAADLTFAALAGAVLVPEQYSIPLPQPDVLPPALAATIRDLRSQPAGAHALAMFREHRHRRVREPATA